MASAVAPGLLEVFRPTIRPSHTRRETQIPKSLYEWFSPIDFSRDILSTAVKRLVALRLRNMEWHDLGHPDRVLSMLLARNAELPAWAKHWQAAGKTMAGFLPRSSSAVA